MDTRRNRIHTFKLYRSTLVTEMTPGEYIDDVSSRLKQVGALCERVILDGRDGAVFVVVHVVNDVFSIEATKKQYADIGIELNQIGDGMQRVTGLPDEVITIFTADDVKKYEVKHD